MTTIDRLMLLIVYLGVMGIYRELTGETSFLLSLLMFVYVLHILYKVEH